MARRIYEMSIKKWAIRIGIPSGVIGSIIFLYLMYLAFIGAITITGYSGDMICAGTEEDPCIALINFTANEDIFLYVVGYDPWGRDVPFEFNPAVKSWKIQRSWGKGWTNIDMNNGCTGSWCGCSWCRKDNPSTYAYAFRAGRSYQIRVLGYKHNPTDTIKWGAFDEIDPYWFGTGETQKFSVPVIEYEPAYDDLQVNITGDEIRVTWNYYEVFDNETNETHTYYRGNSTIKTLIKYLGNNLTYSFADMSPLGVKYGLDLVSNDGITAEWNGSVNLDGVQILMKDNGFQPAFEIEGYKVKGNRIYIDPHISIEWRDKDPNNIFQIHDRNTVYLTNNGSAFHDTIIYDPIITISNVTVDSKFNNVRADDTFTYIEIDDSDDVYLELDGTGDYVDVAFNTIISNTTDYSISAWIYPTELGRTQSIVGFTNATQGYPRLNFESNNRILHHAGGEKYVYSNKVFASGDLNKWWHIVAVVNDTTSSDKWLVYINGVEDSWHIAADTGTYYNPTATMDIGASDGASFFNGSIDEVRIYNTSLSPTDISEIYTSGRVANSSIPNSSDLVGWWSMDEGVGQTAEDSSNEDNTGTLVGDTSWSTWGIGDNLIGYWSFDGDTINEGPGNTTYDFSNENNDGTLYGNATVNSTNCMDNYGNCLHLDGFDGGDYILVDDNGDNFGKTVCIEGCTFSAWGYKRDLGVSGNLIGRLDSEGSDRFFLLRVLSGDDVDFRVYPDGSTTDVCFVTYSAGDIVANRWYHYVGVYDNSTGTGNVSLYRDGVYLKSTTCAFPGINVTPWADNEDVFIGTFDDGDIRDEWNGSIDEVMVFNTSLSGVQISALYFNSSARFKTTANHTILPVNISDGNDRANVTVEFSNNMSSNISLRLGQINITSTNQTGLVLYMPMEWDNITDGKVWDISGNENHGTAYADATFNATGGINDTGGYEFDGDGDYVDVGTGFQTIDNVTVSVWFRADTIGTTSGGIQNYFQSTTDEWGIWVQQQAGVDKIFIYDDIDNVDTVLYATTVTEGVWTHAVGVMKANSSGDGYENILYVNGVEVGSGTNSTGSWSSLSGTLYLGTREPSSILFDGSIDEVMIFDKVLSATEISQMYNDTIEEYNQIYYTDWANLTSGSNIHTIDEEADFLFPEMRYYPGNSTTTSFYTPILRDDITIETYTAEAPAVDTTNPDNVGFLDPTPDNDTNQSINNYFVNVSFNDSNPERCILEMNGTINHSMTQGANTSEWYRNVTNLGNDMTWFIAYCNDTGGRWNNSATRHVNISAVAVGDTCDTCTIDCTENCLVDAELDCSDGELTFTGDGMVGIQADIKNYANVSISGGCHVICSGGYCIV